MTSQSLDKILSCLHCKLHVYGAPKSKVKRTSKGLNSVLVMPYIELLFWSKGCKQFAFLQRATQSNRGSARGNWDPREGQQPFRPNPNGAGDRTTTLRRQAPSISTEELVLPHHARCVLSRLRCNGHSVLLGSNLTRIGRIENPSCSACGHSSQDTSHLILHCPATDSLRRSLFGDSLSLYDLWSRPWRVARLLGLHGLPPCPHPLEGVG